MEYLDIMMTVKRYLNLDLPQGQSAFLWGARKTGKTTFLHQKFPHAIFIDLLQSEVFAKYSLNPHYIRLEILAIPEEKRCGMVIVIDEIQKIPQILNEVHWMIENIKGVSFILCGSSSRKLKSSGSNLLGGRAWRYQMFPFCYSEIKELNWDRIFNRGLIPAHYFSEFASKSLSAYVYDYLINEVQLEANIRRRDPFIKFLDVVALSNTEMINFTNIARDCGVNKATAKSYFEILEDMYIGYFLYPYAKRKNRQIITQIPKFYLFDTGVANYLAKYTFTGFYSSEAGKAFEHYIFLELKLYQVMFNIREELFYYRDSEGHEVDFILGNQAFEVKTRSNITFRDIKGLLLFGQDYGAMLNVISTTDRKRIETFGTQTVTIWPVQEFLESLWSNSLY
ncbi:ATP-binding protein [Candidatus Tisiphia endosymbiont of Dioctria rufipes]|uniref:ATP-binding protein n=2 Tax=unclassified Candidatus Tisiphia TaxID=2996318 RepID=UPI00312C894C